MYHKIIVDDKEYIGDRIKIEIASKGKEVIIGTDYVDNHGHITTVIDGRIKDFKVITIIELNKKVLDEMKKRAF